MLGVLSRDWSCSTPSYCPFSPQVLANQPQEGTSSSQVGDIEDFGAAKRLQPSVPIANKRKRVPTAEESQEMSQSLELSQSWREILGPPPSMGTTKVGRGNWGTDLWPCAKL